MKTRLFVNSLLSLCCCACTPYNNTPVTTAAGGAAGAAIGGLAYGGNPVAMIAGAAIGGLAGYAIGTSLDRQDAYYQNTQIISSGQTVYYYENGHRCKYTTAIIYRGTQREVIRSRTCFIGRNWVIEEN